MKGKLQNTEHAVMRCKEIGSWMEEWAPPALAESWDNTGWQAGDPQRRLTGVLVCLDVTDACLDAAIDFGCNLIVSHHPPLFSPLRSVTSLTRQGRLVGRCWQENIQLFACHTNFDAAENGLAHMFAHTVGLEEIRIFPGDDLATLPPCGRSGLLEKTMPLPEFVESLKKSLKTEMIRIIGQKPVAIRRVVTQNGAYDSDLLPYLHSDNCDVLVTGDVKYHDAFDLAQAGIFVCDAGHFSTERMFVSEVAQALRKAFPGLLVQEAMETDIYTGV